MKIQHTALVALGSNLGSSKEIIHQAFEALEQVAQGTVKKSSLWQTAPIQCPAGSPCFINAAMSIDVPKDINPNDFLKTLLKIESNLGRKRSGVINEPRFIDIDLICLGNIRIKSKSLTLPHPRAHIRSFVLAPLAEIAPGFKFPGLNKTTQELLSELSLEEECTRL